MRRDRGQKSNPRQPPGSGRAAGHRSSQCPWAWPPSRRRREPSHWQQGPPRLQAGGGSGSVRCGAARRRQRRVRRHPGGTGGAQPRRRSPDRRGSGNARQWAMIEGLTSSDAHCLALLQRLALLLLRAGRASVGTDCHNILEGEGGRHSGRRALSGGHLCCLPHQNSHSTTVGKAAWSVKLRADDNARLTRADGRGLERS